MPERHRVPTVRRLLRHRWQIALLLAALGALAGVSVAGLATIRTSAETAAEHGGHLDLGGYAYGLLSEDPQVAGALTASDEAEATATYPAEVDTGHRRGTATLRIAATERAHFAVLITGDYPSGRDEALLSVALADALGVGVGDSVRIHVESQSVPVTVTGVGALPNEAGAELVQMQDPQLLGLDATAWLADPEFFDVAHPPVLEAALTARQVPLTGAETVASARVAMLPSGVRTLSWAPALVGGLTVLVMAGGFVGCAPVARRDVAGLAAAGAGPRRAWRLVILTASGVCLGGAVVGFGAGSALVWILRRPISAILGQYWLVTTVPWVGFLVLIAAIGVLVVASLRVPRYGHRRVGHRTVTRPPPRRVPWVLAGMTMTAIGAGLVLRPHLARLEEGDISRSWAYLGPPLVAGGVALLGVRALGTGLPVGRRAVVRALTASVAMVTAPVLAVGALAAGYSTLTMQGIRVSQEATTERDIPLGAALVGHFPVREVSDLHDRYVALGGTSTRALGSLVETRQVLRVVHPDVLGCAGAGDRVEAIDRPGCSPPQARSLSDAGVDPALPSEEIRADPTVIDDGEVGLLVIEPQTSVIIGTQRVKAKPDAELGGFAPGMAFGPHSPLLRNLGFERSGLATVVLRGFDRLDPGARATLHNTILQEAPGASYLDDDMSSELVARDRLIADVLGVAGGLTVMLIFGAGVGTLLLGKRRLRRTLAEIGPLISLRIDLIARVLGVPVLGALVVTALIPAMATTVIGGDGGLSLGVAWVLPFAAVIVTSVVLGVLFLRVPAVGRD